MAPKRSQIAASPDASQPSTAPRLCDRGAEYQPISPSLTKRRLETPWPPDAPDSSAPLSGPRPPHGPVSRGCRNCMAANREVPHPVYSEIPGKRYFPSTRLGYVEWLRRCGPPLPDAAAVAAEESALETRRSSMGSAKSSARSARLSGGRLVQQYPQLRTPGRKKIYLGKLPTPLTPTRCAPSARGTIRKPPDPAPIGIDRASRYSCGRCKQSFEYCYRPMNMPSGNGFYRPLTDGPSFRQWVNRRIECRGKPPLNSEALDACCRERGNSHKTPSINAKEFRNARRGPIARVSTQGAFKRPAGGNPPSGMVTTMSLRYPEFARTGEPGGTPTPSPLRKVSESIGRSERPVGLSATRGRAARGGRRGSVNLGAPPHHSAFCRMGRPPLRGRPRTPVRWGKNTLRAPACSYRCGLYRPISGIKNPHPP